jgi:hypothetical protein
LPKFPVKPAVAGISFAGYTEAVGGRNYPIRVSGNLETRRHVKLIDP